MQSPVQFRMKARRALSPIISITLLILLVIAIVSIIAVFSKDTIKNLALSPKYSCEELQLSNILKIEKVCLNKEANSIELTISRQNQETEAGTNFRTIEINRIDFSLIYENSASSTSFSCYSTKESCSTCAILSSNTLKTYYLKQKDNNKAIKVAISLYNCQLDDKDIINC